MRRRNNRVKEEDKFKEYLEQKDVEKIKQYIIDAYSRKHGPKKIYRFYLALAHLYPIYTKTIQELIVTTQKWGYGKDYLYLLTAAKKKRRRKMINFIYDHLIEKLHDDAMLYREDKRISTLAKWLPRQKSSFDKSLNFVEHMCNRMYPGYRRRTARNLYRKAIVTLSKYINVTEQMLCAKRYDEIDFNHVPVVCYRHMFNTFIRHEVARNKLEKFLREKYGNYRVQGLVSLVFNKKVTPFEQNIINDIWEKNRSYYVEQLREELGKSVDTTDVIVDLSKSLYDSKHICDIIGICMLALDGGNKVILNHLRPTEFSPKSTQFCDIMRELEMDYCSYDKLMIVESLRLTTNTKVFIITDKPCMFENQSSKKISYWQILDADTMEKKRKNGVKIYIGNFRRKKEKINRRKLILMDILEKSVELTPKMETVDSSFSWWKVGVSVLGVVGMYTLFPN